MDLFAIDDSAQTNPTRHGMRALVSIGGLHVPGEAVRELELAIDVLCDEFGFPAGEEFKWSPGRETWERNNLQGEHRDEFNLRALQLTHDAGAQGIVVMTDTACKLLDGAGSHEEAVTLMFLERAHACLPADRHAIVVFDRPSGDRQSETKFLASTLTTLRTGTAYSKLDRLALPVATDSKLSRLVQLADVITGCATSYVAGEARFSPRIFTNGVLPLLREEHACTGGRGLKLHPDFRYRNLYHWLLGDERFVRYRQDHALPSSKHPYSASADQA
jgi:uncharacterized protein DUF3800